MTNWIKDGKKITGLYYDKPYSGTIINTRCKYGTDVQYTVQLDTPIDMYGDIRERILVDMNIDFGYYKIID